MGPTVKETCVETLESKDELDHVYRYPYEMLPLLHIIV